jgi:phytoene dehydrogenase-like protein
VLAPASAHSAYIPLHQQRQSRPLPKGGSGALTVALSRLIEAHQGTILTNKWVTAFIIENGRCMGVECADGSSYRAEKAVVSTIHIKQLVDMAPKELWGEDFLEGVDTWEAGLTLFATNYATTAPPKYKVDGGELSPVHSGMMVNSERAMQMGLDYATGAVNLENPPLHVICCSTVDPTRAPAGMHTIKVVAYHPYQLKEGPQHWDAIKEHVSDESLKFLRCFSPNLTPDKFLAHTVESPLDLERMNPHNWHGSCHAGGSGPAQSGALRPMPGYAQHRMPIPGLYQTGATTHPGGSVTGGPGRNAATVMLKDFGTSLEAVVQRKD